MNNFMFLEGVSLSNLCDYSFGDQASIVCNIQGGYMKPANCRNTDFLNRVNEISKTRNWMTLFIDNIRLYKREIKFIKECDTVWVEKLFQENNLLDLLSTLPHMNFIIFTNLEDLSVKKDIESHIPKNVLKICGSNFEYNSKKVIPLPYGLQRKMYPSDNRHEVIKFFMSENITPTKLLYVNHNISTNPIERSGIHDLFVNFEWATVDKTHKAYEHFLLCIKQHKFMISPIGNALDCHRTWEILYLRRVPVMKKNEFLEFLLKDFPVLFVEDYKNITEEILLENEHLYIEAQNFDLDKLNLLKIFENQLPNTNYIKI